MEHVKVRVLEEIVEENRKTIITLREDMKNLYAELDRVRAAGLFYLAMQKTITEYPEILGPVWEEFCTLLMLHTSEEDLKRYEQISKYGTE